MAAISETVCDVDTCAVRAQVRSFSVFSHRAQDGAGSMEDWDLVFDLCPGHAAALLGSLLKRTAEASDTGAVKALLAARGIKTRLE